MARKARVMHGGRGVMRLKAVAAVVPLVLLAACSTSSTAAKPSSPATTSTGQFLGQVRAATGLTLPDARVRQLATAVCDDISVNGNGAPDAAIMLQQSPDTGSLSDAQASDFVQAAVLYACPDLYVAADYLHPGKFKTR